MEKRKSLTSVMQFLIKNNLYLPSVNSIYIWIKQVEKKKYITFSLIQAQRNYFGKHKIKFFNKQIANR